MFDDDYWATQRVLLDTEYDIRHVNFAKFVHDHCGDSTVYVEGIGWHRWTGTHWQATADEAPAMQTITDATQILLKRAGESAGDMRWASSAASKMLVASHRAYIVREMKFLPEFRRDVDVIDAQPHLLNFKNGTVDLRTGELRAHRPADMLTQITNVNYVPDAKCPRWDRFVEEIFPRDDDLQRYYQTFLGYCITGETRDHALGVWYGAHGRNGKGTTVRTMQAVFGTDIVLDVPFELFEKTRGNAPHTELIAGLRGARMVVAQEGNQGVPMDTARLKNYTGGDRISTRHLHGKQFTFQPSFTLVLATNHLPEFASGGAALWARTKAVLFGESFADRVDRDLEPTIQGPEAEGVAAWVVRGAVEYYRQGRLIDPLSVVAATEMHKDEVDPLKPLLGEVFVYDERAVTPTREFNVSLKEWRSDIGDQTNKFAPGAVKRHLLNSGSVTERRVNNRTCFVGVRLCSDPDYVADAGPGIFDRSVD